MNFEISLPISQALMHFDFDRLFLGIHFEEPCRFYTYIEMNFEKSLIVSCTLILIDIVRTVLRCQIQVTTYHLTSRVSEFDYKVHSFFMFCGESAPAVD